MSRERKEERKRENKKRKVNTKDEAELTREEHGGGVASSESGEGKLWHLSASEVLDKTKPKTIPRWEKELGGDWELTVPA